MDAFREAVLALPPEASTQPTPHVRFTSLRGAALEVTYSETPRVDGVPVDYAGWKLFDGPFLQGSAGEPAAGNAPRTAAPPARLRRALRHGLG
jgi:hypothetical protein